MCVHTHACVFVDTGSVYVHVGAHMLVCAHVYACGHVFHVCVCTHVYSCACMCIRVHACVYSCAHVCIRVHMCVFVCTCVYSCALCICVHVCLHVCLHVHMHVRGYLSVHVFGCMWVDVHVWSYMFFINKFYWYKFPSDHSLEVFYVKNVFICITCYDHSLTFSVQDKCQP